MNNIQLNSLLLDKVFQLALDQLDSHECKIDLGERSWQKMQIKQLKEKFSVVSKLDAETMLNSYGGQWLASARSFIQCRAINGCDVSWGSHEPLNFRGIITVSDIEHLAANAVKVFIKFYAE